MIKDQIYELYHSIAQLIPKISWPGKSITDEQKQDIAEKLASNYYIILTADKNHLSSRLITWMSFLLTGKKATYSHVLMNCDFMSDIKDLEKFKFVEATAKGVHYSTFEEVFEGVTNVCLLKPRFIKVEDWTNVIDQLVKEVGTPYDDLFDLTSKEKMSCVEVIVNAFNYNDSSNIFLSRFPELEIMISEKKNLTPQMFRDCNDFDVELEVEA